MFLKIDERIWFNLYFTIDTDRYWYWYCMGYHCAVVKKNIWLYEMITIQLCNVWTSSQTDSSMSESWTYSCVLIIVGHKTSLQVPYSQLLEWCGAVGCGEVWDTLGSEYWSDAVLGVCIKCGLSWLCGGIFQMWDKLAYNLVGRGQTPQCRQVCKCAFWDWLCKSTAASSSIRLYSGT